MIACARVADASVSQENELLAIAKSAEDIGDYSKIDSTELQALGMDNSASERSGDQLILHFCLVTINLSRYARV